jgi:hydrogenase-4 component F
MLAYSSVEHMGILSIGAALGGAGVAAALFHVWSNGLTKGALFLSAGNIRRAAGSPSMDDVRGMSVLTPRSAAIFVTGMFAVTAAAIWPALQRAAWFMRPLRRARFAVAIFLGWPAGVLRITRRVCDRGWSSPPLGRTSIGQFAETPVCPSRRSPSWACRGLGSPQLLQDAWSAAVLQLFPMP